MNRRLRKELQHAFVAPEPTKKEAFLRKLNYPKTTWFQFILDQASYIKIRTWMVSVVIIGLIIYIANNLFHNTTLDNVNIEMIRISSALMPPLVLNAVTEIMRSRQHGMEELEMTTRYSLAKVVLVRMGLLGVSNFIVVVCITLVLAQKTGLGFFRISVYLLIPYLATILVTLWMINRKTSRDVIYPCGAASILVSSMILILGSIREVWYLQHNFIVWIMVLFLLLILATKELRKTIKISEELRCNSQLTV